MLSPKSKRKLFQVLPFAIISMIFSLNYVLIEKGILGNSSFYPSTGNPYAFTPIVNVLVASISGLLIGMIEVLYLYKKFNNTSFLLKVFYKTGIYLLIIIIFIFVNTLIGNAFEIGAPIWDERVWNFMWIFFSSFAFWSIVLYLGVSISIALFYLEVSDNIGQEVLFNFFRGKYHQPIEEERIFMFLDMKSSTTIAETLGHVRYFKMLREYYSDLSDSIIVHAGEIYQYVGDEIVLTWDLNNGLAHNNCIRCFFAMKEALTLYTERYQSTYGVVPTFKAGLHYGRVTTGEIGVIKKEITFTGDVLNATARIQSLCNSYQTDILISSQLKERLNLDSGYSAQELGETELRGRNEKMELYTVQKTDTSS